MQHKTIDIMRLLKIISLIIILGFANTRLFSQSNNYEIKTLSINEGLSNNTINSTVEDKTAINEVWYKFSGISA